MILNLFKFVAYNSEEKFELIATSVKNAKAVILLLHSWFSQFKFS